MKIIIYNLNENGTIPDYIIDGGYLPVVNDKNPPQDLDLVGVATNEATQAGFSQKTDLVDYINNNVIFDNLDEKESKIATIVDILWNKLG